jgi:hypothetical protein
MAATKGQAGVEAPAWQRGYPLDELKAIAATFAAHDDGLILGAFSAYKENAVADALASGRLEQAGGVAMDRAVLARPLPIRDFTGEVRAQAQAGDVYVRRLAYLPGQEDAALAVLRDLKRPLWVQAWIEHPGDRQVMEGLGASLACTKIKASSEMIGVYYVGAGEGLFDDAPYAPAPAADHAALVRLATGLDVAPLCAAVDALGVDYADHYSTYNRGHSWSALALRGYSNDPNFIIKPSEMSKKWKRENPDALDWWLRDTPLRAKLPEAEPLIAALPGDPHRVRLMRLAPGGGELERHADITDPDAGTGDGQLLRLHMPLVTNDQCVFESWRLDGQRLEAVMRPGECWYLDTRKPHTARNGGDTERLHLVVDMACTPELRQIVVDADG